MSGRRQSDRPKKLPARYVGWYGLRMLTASREKTPKPQLAGGTADDVQLSAVLQGDHQNTLPPDKRTDDDHQNTVLPDKHQSTVSEDERVDHNDNQNVAPSGGQHQSCISPDEFMDNNHQIAVTQDECINGGDPIAVPPDDQIAVPPDDQIAVPPDDQVTVPPDDQIADEQIAGPPDDQIADDQIAVPPDDQATVPPDDQIADDQIAVPPDDQTTVPPDDQIADDQIAVPPDDQADVPPADQIADDQIAVPPDDQVALPPDEQADVPPAEQIAVLSDHQIAITQDECIDDSHQSTVPPHGYHNVESPDECMDDDDREPERIARDRFRRKSGYTILKRRTHELRKRMHSFSPPERTVVYRRLILNETDEDDENIDDDCEQSVNDVPIQTDESQKKVRKRQRNDDKWKRNVIKRARLTGQAYISSTGKKISAKSPVLDDNLCGKSKCRLNCGDKIDKECRAAIMAQYYELASESQTAHLFSSLNVSTPKWSVVNAERHREISVKYTVNVSGASVTVCKKAFMNIYGISQSKVDHVVCQLRAGHATVRPSLRGKHSNRPNRLTQVTIDSIKEHVNLYPAEMSHYSRCHNPNRMYLSPLLSICEMYRQYKVWANERGVPPASLAAYRRVFCTHFNLGFGSPRSDTCCKCEASDSVDIARHKELAEVAFQQQRQDREEARTKSNVTYITFDLQKTLPLPKLSVSKAFYLRQLWVYNMGIHVVAKGKEGPHFSVWTEDEGGRGVTEVASALMAFVQSLQKTGGTLIAWSDSCSGQNKNFVMLCLWQYLLAKNFFQCIQHKFPEPGHSFLDSDRDFGRIEAGVRRHENVYTLDKYCDIMLQSARKSRPVLTRMSDKMSNISKFTNNTWTQEGRCKLRW